jgi:hypothetical protein
MWHQWETTVLTGDRKIVDSVLVGRPKEERQLGRPRYTWKDNIKKDLQEVECNNMGCNDLTHDRGRRQAVVRAVLNIRVPASQEGFCSMK